MASLSSFGSRLELLDALGEAHRLFAERRVLGRELARRAGVVPGGSEVTGGLDDRTQLGVALAETAGLGLVGMHRRVGESPLDFRVFAGQIVDIHVRSWVGTGADTPTPTGEASGRRGTSGYFLLPPAAFLPKRRSNRATRPPVSRIFCLPV
jgi:hypothetical protein